MARPAADGPVWDKAYTAIGGNRLPGPGDPRDDVVVTLSPPAGSTR